MKKKFLLSIIVLTLSFGCSMSVCAQPKAMPDGTIFDAEYYAQSYPDVVAFFGTDADLLYQHYVQYGKAEGRNAVAPTRRDTVDAAVQTKQIAEDFDASYYARSNPDVVAVFGTDPYSLYQHYTKYGKIEGRHGKEPEPDAVPKENKRRIFELVNEERMKKGLSELLWDDTIEEAAGVRAVEISKVFKHIRPDGRQCWTAMTDLGMDYLYDFGGENIAAGYFAPEGVIQGWMDNPAHRANILRQSPGISRMAVGYYMGENGKSYWVLIFGK